MPKIVLTVETENVSELTTIIAELAGNFEGGDLGADAPEKPQGRRGRPKKGDTLAPGAEAANTTSGSATAASGASLVDASSPATFAAQVNEANAQAAEDAAAAMLMGGGDQPAPTVTADDVANAMRAHLKKHGAEKTQGVLMAKANAKDFKSVPAEKYGEVYAALQAEI